MCLAALLLGVVTSTYAATPPTVGYVTANMNATSQVRSLNAFVALGKEKGWRVLTADAKGSWPALADQIENYVQMGVDVIVVAMSDLPSIQPAIESANKAGIPVISIDSGVAEGVAVDITTDNFVMGSKISSFMMDMLDHKGNIIVFKFLEHHGTRKRGRALDMVLTENPEVKVLATHNLPPAGFMQDAQARWRRTSPSSETRSMRCGARGTAPPWPLPWPWRQLASDVTRCSLQVSMANRSPSI